MQITTGRIVLGSPKPPNNRPYTLGENGLLNKHYHSYLI